VTANALGFVLKLAFEEVLVGRVLTPAGVGDAYLLTEEELPAVFAAHSVTRKLREGTARVAGALALLVV
jgi:hypothetical protein